MLTSSAPSARLDIRSIYLRHLIVDALEGGRRGHVGSPLSVIEILRVLYDDVLNVRPEEPEWRDRDRCILSKGHACLAHYAILADRGFFPLEELRQQCRYGALLGGHPESHIPGIEVSTGALGHGLSVGIGLALAARMRGRSSRTFVVLGDGEMGEGSVWEAALSAGKHRLDTLTVVVDYNKLQSYGLVSEILGLEPLEDKLSAFGFDTRHVDGHDVAALKATFAALPFEPGKPNAVIAHTIKGRGIDFAEHDPNWHHKSNLGEPEIGDLRAALERAS